MRILLVDDDSALMETLEEGLIQQRYAVDIALDGEAAREFVALFSYDLIILDMTLPDVEGITLCRQLRDQRVSSPILMLTASDANIDKVRALDAGADDYVTKPFDFDELYARIRALLRRNNDALSSTLRWGDLTVVSGSFEVFYGECQVHTTPKEYALLEMFLHHPKQVFSLDAIIENLWAFEDPPSEDAVRTHVKGLRQKLKAGGAPKDFVETVYGIGYRLKSLDTDARTTQLSPGINALTESDVEAAVAKAWNTHSGTMQERLSLLEEVSEALRIGALSSELHDMGRSQAHKLAGSLGCFGFPEGSRLARELEHLLQLDAPLDYQYSSRFSDRVQQLRQSLTSGSSRQATVAVMAPETPAPETVKHLQACGLQLWIIGADEHTGRSLSSEASSAGLRATVVATPTAAQGLLAEQSPEGVLLWLEDSNFEAAIAFLEALLQGSAKSLDTIPILAITTIQSFHRRLEAVQLGIDRLLPMTASPQHVMEVMRQVDQVNRADPKVVILDDDAQVLDLLKRLLEPWGFWVTTLDNPAELEPVLDFIQPDILILDVEMPEANGLEICQVLRTDERWHQLPILFLTVHEEADIQQQAFHVGADDFISKSAIATELPVRIQNRLRRQ
ncbi:MAG: response regulator [Elainellaceae cyanobacterium]